MSDLDRTVGRVRVRCYGAACEEFGAGHLRDVGMVAGDLLLTVRLRVGPCVAVDVVVPRHERAQLAHALLPPCPPGSQRDLDRLEQDLDQISGPWAQLGGEVNVVHELIERVRRAELALQALAEQGA